MESIKEKLVNNIKEWIQLDNEIIQLNSEVKKRKTKKKELTDSLLNIMKEEHLDCLNINGGSLVYKANKVKKPISAKSLLVALQNYYKEDSELAEQLTRYIMDNREEKVREVITRKIDKS
jgi:predicted  nucleic acid-binding Zn-ribbon protein